MHRTIDFNHHSETGRKSHNDDTVLHSFCTELALDSSILNQRGSVFIIADGVSAAEKGGEGGSIACQQFIKNFYLAPRHWNIEALGKQLIQEINLRLYHQGCMEFSDGEHGYACTFTCLVIHSNRAHIFHVGDTRAYVYRNDALKVITSDHSSEGPNGHSYLENAIGAQADIRIDYHKIDVEEGDIFLLSCDGIHDTLVHSTLAKRTSELDSKLLAQDAYAEGSDDNLSSLMCRINTITPATESPRYLPRELSHQTIEELHITKFLFEDNQSSGVYRYYRGVLLENNQKIILKYLVESLAHNDQLNRFYFQIWQHNKINESYLCKHIPHSISERFHCVLLEDCGLMSLADIQSRISNIKLRCLIDIQSQLLASLESLSRYQLTLSYLDPRHVYVNKAGELKLLSLRLHTDTVAKNYYSSPEHVAKEATEQWIFSSALMVYEHLSNRHPFGNVYSSKMSTSQRDSLRYQSLLIEHEEIPLWFDAALRKALSPHPEERYYAHKGFIEDLLQPNPEYLEHEFITRYSQKLPVFPLWKLLSTLWIGSIAFMGYLVF